MQSLPVPTHEDPISFLTPTGKLVLILLHLDSLRASCSFCWLIFFPVSSIHFHAPCQNNWIESWFSSGMLTGIKAISEVAAAIVILNQNALVSLPVPSPLPTSLLLVLLNQPQFKLILSPSGASVGFVSTSLQPSVYQVLVDRGWRRYGNIFFILYLLAESLAYVYTCC